MKYVVFITKCKVNDKLFLGVDEETIVFNGHLGDGVYVNQPATYMYPKTPFQCAVKRYGTKNFDKFTLYTFDNELQAQTVLNNLLTKDFINSDNNYNGYPYGLDLYVNQYSTEGTYIKNWRIKDAAEFYGLSTYKIKHAIVNRVPVVNTLWSLGSDLDIDKYRTKPWGEHEVTHVYTEKGKWVCECSNYEECAKLLNTTVDEVKEHIKNQRLINGCYVANFVTDEYKPKPRKQYDHAHFYVYNSKCKLITECDGKDIMHVMGLHSWAKIAKVFDLYNGWYNDMCYSLEPLNELPTRYFGVKVDVFDKYGNYIETVPTLQHLRNKYKVPSSKLKRIEKGDKWFGDYIFKYHNR